MTSTSKKYQKLDQREHVLKRPNMYIGCIDEDRIETYVYNSDSNSIEKKEINYIAGLYKLFDEIIVNTLDHIVRLKDEEAKQDEDLIIDKKNTFLKVLEFIYKLNKIEFIVDYQKLNNAIESTSFENMQLLEKKYGFEEAAIDKNNNKINFFHLGKKNRWEDILDKNIRKKIEKSFKKEMKELGYL